MKRNFAAGILIGLLLAFISSSQAQDPLQDLPVLDCPPCPPCPTFPVGAPEIDVPPLPAIDVQRPSPDKSKINQALQAIEIYEGQYEEDVEIEEPEAE